MEGGIEAAARLQRDQYHVAELLYISEVDPVSKADVLVDNSDFARSRIAGRGAADGAAHG